MNPRLILISLFWFFVAHIAVWFQLNGQFKWEWFKNNEWILALCGVPISFLYLWATKYAVNGFDGLLWPGRFVGFGVGMVIYAIFTGYFFSEGITTKTAISLGLSLMLISVQLFWK
jgi:MFS family permease